MKKPPVQPSGFDLFERVNEVGIFSIGAGLEAQIEIIGTDGGQVVMPLLAFMQAANACNELLASYALDSAKPFSMNIVLESK